MTPTEIGLTVAAVTAVVVMSVLLFVVFFNRKGQNDIRGTVPAVTSIQGQAAAQGVLISPQQAAVIARVVEGSNATAADAPPIEATAAAAPAPAIQIADFWSRFNSQAGQLPTLNILRRPLGSSNSSRECGGCLTGRRKRSRKSSRKSSRIA